MSSALSRRAVLIGGSCLAAAVANSGVGQRPAKMVRLGWLARNRVTTTTQVFINTLRRLGWRENENLVIDRRFGNSTEGYDKAAAALVAARPDVLFGIGGPDVAALLSKTQTIPIVFAAVSDPIAVGFVKSLAHPGGNVTGISTMTPQLEVKQLQLMHEVLPHARQISMLRDPQNPGSDSRFAIDAAAAPSLGLSLVRRQVSTGEEIDRAFAAAAADRDDAMHVEFSGMTLVERNRIVALASKYRLPASYGVRPYAEAGGLFAYGPVYSTNFERAAALVDKILHGAKPADLPVEEPTQFELVINLKTAEALSLIIPPSLLARADEVIE